MPTTAKDIIQAANARRSANDPDVLAARKELVRTLSRNLQRLYVDVAKVNKRYFMDVDEIAAEQEIGEWPLPEDAILVFRLELVGAVGLDGRPQEVAIVPLTDQDAEEGIPRVYELGLNFRTVGFVPTAEQLAAGYVADPVPATDSLRMFFSVKHPPLDPALPWDSEDNTLHSSWPEQHNDLLVDGLALYLAQKDGREPKETVALELAVKAGRELLLEEAMLHKSSERRRWSDTPRAGQ